MNRCTIVVLRNEEQIGSFSTVLQKGGMVAQVEFIGTLGSGRVKTFKTTERKPALRAAMEAVMLSFKGYNPQTDRVTLATAIEAESGPEGF